MADAQTLADRLLSLKMTTLMPPWQWSTLRPQCITCEWRTRHPRDGERWPAWTREQLQERGAAELHCEDGALVLVLPFDIIGWDERGGCLLHEVCPVWDEQLIGEAFNMQDFSDWRPTHFKPLELFSHTSLKHWKSDRFVRDLLRQLGAAVAAAGHKQS